jgi:hypothetical protein
MVMLQLPVKMARCFEPKPRSVIQEVTDYLRAHRGHWPSLKRRKTRRRPHLDRAA